jgi:hypothetical protein
VVAWCTANRVSEAAITDGLIFMAITMIVVRTAGLRGRAAPAARRGLSHSPARSPPAREPTPAGGILLRQSR